MTGRKKNELSRVARIGDLGENLALAAVIAVIGLCIAIPTIAGLGLIVWLLSLLG